MEKYTNKVLTEINANEPFLRFNERDYELITGCKTPVKEFDFVYDFTLNKLVQSKHIGSLASIIFRPKDKLLQRIQMDKVKQQINSIVNDCMTHQGYFLNDEYEIKKNNTVNRILKIIDEEFKIKEV